MHTLITLVGAPPVLTTSYASPVALVTLKCSVTMAAAILIAVFAIQTMSTQCPCIEKTIIKTLSILLDDIVTLPQDEI